MAQVLLYVGYVIRRRFILLRLDIHDFTFL